MTTTTWRTSAMVPVRFGAPPARVIVAPASAGFIDAAAFAARSDETMNDLRENGVTRSVYSWNVAAGWPKVTIVHRLGDALGFGGITVPVGFQPEMRSAMRLARRSGCSSGIQCEPSTISNR